MSAKLKVPRAVGIKHDEKAEEFKKKLPETLEKIKKYLTPPRAQSRNFRYWCEDESRLGLKTEVGRLITVKGVKPLGKMQWIHRKLLFIWVSRTVKWRIFYWGIFTKYYLFSDFFGKIC